MTLLVVGWLLVLVTGATGAWTWVLPAAAGAVLLYRLLAPIRRP